MDALAARNAEPIAALVARDGTAAFAGALLRADVKTRDLADAIHALCAIHCHHPGVVDNALANAPQNVTVWLQAAREAFRGERGYLASLTSAVGPIPSTPGQADAEVALSAQRHALEMLSRSDRAGCAFGAAVALILDWQAIRTVLDRTAQRLGLSSPPQRLPGGVETSIVIEAAGAGAPMTARAAVFGAQQLIAQHRGLWHLLEARAIARQHCD